MLVPVALARALLEVEVREAEPETAPEEAAVVPGAKTSNPAKVEHGTVK